MKLKEYEIKVICKETTEKSYSVTEETVGKVVEMLAGHSSDSVGITHETGKRQSYKYDDTLIKNMLETGASVSDIAKHCSIPYQSMRNYIQKHPEFHNESEVSSKSDEDG
jgi:hypothetical protein